MGLYEKEQQQKLEEEHKVKNLLLAQICKRKCLQIERGKNGYLIRDSGLNTYASEEFSVYKTFEELSDALKELIG